MPDIPNPFSPLDHLLEGKRYGYFSLRSEHWMGKLNPLKKFFSKKIEVSEKDESVKDTSSDPKNGLENIPELLGKPKRAPFKVSWARNAEEIKEAQRLRYKVFAEEMGAHLPENDEGLDTDEFDPYCDHLLVRDSETLRVIGTYRVLAPHKATELGRLYSDSEFDLSRLNHLRPKIVEVGRSCVHKDYRSGAVIMALWSGLGQYMKQHQYEIMLGCASIPMADGGHYAASLYNSLSPDQIAPVENHAFPKLPLPLDRLNGGLDVEAPPLIKGYLKLGAKICSAPAWDPDFNTADLLTMLRLSDINPRYAKHFLDKAD
jgi:putative hemolysin